MRTYLQDLHVFPGNGGLNHTLIAFLPFIIWILHTSSPIVFTGPIIIYHTNSTHFLLHCIYRANNYKNRINVSKPSPGDQEIIMAACTNQKFIFQMRVILRYPFLYPLLGNLDAGGNGKTYWLYFIWFSVSREIL